ncbi:MAG TPA: contractile injection system tape measure protein [Dongiaceae bacterium]|jgi:hypothetical protein|nr:contractile injection system tape measure protein [Dongiaceae bacterium]
MTGAGKVTHTVRVQKFTVAVESETLALSLQPRLTELNERHLLPVMERIFDVFNPPDERLFIDCLKIDLGILDLQRLESDLGPRFEQCLTEALSRYQRENQELRKLTTPAARLTLLRQYLEQGTVPFWAGDPAAFSLTRLLLACAEEDAAGLLRFLGTILKQRSARLRLAWHLDPEVRRTLIDLLGPTARAYVRQSGGVTPDGAELSPSDGIDRRSQALHLLDTSNHLPSSREADESRLSPLPLENEGAPMAAVSASLEASSVALLLFLENGDWNTTISSFDATNSQEGASPQSVLAQGVGPRHNAFSAKDEAGKDKDEMFYVKNAGLVLLWPFLPHFFDRLKLLQEDPNNTGRKRFADGMTLSRAARLLQVLCDGRADAPEPELLLNKILCGVEPAVPIAPAIEITSQEAQLCEDLLYAIIQAWTTIRNSSPAALQEGFLQREGRLRKSDGAWRLQVQRKTLDVLLDQVPWSFSILVADWLPQPFYVTW